MSISIKKYGATTTLLALIGLIPGLSLFTFNVIGFNFDFFPGDMGDGRFNLYVLEHAYKYFSGQLSSFWNAPFMYPETNVMAFSDNLLGSAPIYALFRLFGMDIYTSYQLWFVIISALNYIAAFYFLKYVFKNNYVAVLGAFVFAFSMALQSQLTHAQTFPRYAIPLALLMAVKFSENLKPSYFLFTLILVVYQIYCGIYLGFMLSIPVGIFLLIIIIRALIYNKEVILNFKWLIANFLSGILSVGILLPVILPYLERKISPGFEHYKQISHSIPTLKSYLFSQQGSLIWDFLSETGLNDVAWWDHQIFAGGIATISFILGFIWLIAQLAKTKVGKNTLSIPLILILTGLITFVLFLRVNEISAYFALYFLPGFSSLRSVTRIINIELIFFAVSTAFVFLMIFKNNFRYKFLVFLVTLSLLIVDNYFLENRSYRTKVSEAKSRIDQIEKEFAQIPPNSLVSYEPLKMENASIFYQLDAMLASQKYNLKTLNGYTATSPHNYGMYWNEPNEKTRMLWLSNQKIDQDTLYIIKAPGKIEIASGDDLLNFDGKTLGKFKLENLIKYIRTDKKWMEQIEIKAKQKKIPVDSMLILDAMWVIENEE